MPMILSPLALQRWRAYGHRHHLDCGGDAPSPDPLIGESALKNAAIGDRMAGLAETQYADQKALLDEFSPLLKEMIGKSVEAQDLSTQRSNASWDDYNNTWKPVEAELAKRSLAMADPARADAEAARAGGAVTEQFDRARTETRNSLSMAGASQEKIAALEAAGRLGEAKAVAGASSAARADTEKAGIAYLDNAARFGRNMTSTGIATAQLAGQQGQSVQSGYGNLSAAMAAPAQGAASLYSGAVGANSSAGNLALGDFNAKMQSSNQQMGVMGDLLGAGLGAIGQAGGIAAFFSSEKMKDMGPRVDEDDASEAVEASPAFHWKYKPGLGDATPRQGPTAESLHKVAPTVSDGTKVDGIAMLGMHHAAIANQNKRLKRLERSLSHARKG